MQTALNPVQYVYLLGVSTLDKHAPDKSRFSEIRIFCHVIIWISSPRSQVHVNRLDDVDPILTAKQEK